MHTFNRRKLVGPTLLAGFFLLYGLSLLWTGFTNHQPKEAIAQPAQGILLPSDDTSSSPVIANPPKAGEAISGDSFVAIAPRNDESGYPPLQIQLDRPIVGKNMTVEFSSEAPRCQLSVKDQSGRSHTITTTLLSSSFEIASSPSAPRNDSSIPVIARLAKPAEAISTPEVNGHQLVYRFPSEDVELEYLVFDGQLKENIYINSENSPREFTFSVQVDAESQLISLPDGSIVLMDKAQGEELFSIDKPFAQDATGKIIDYQISLENNQLTLTPKDLSQFNGVTYPVILDPSYTVATTTGSYYSTAYNNSRKLARASNGRLHCIYVKRPSSYDQIYYAYSDDNGQNWTEEAVTSNSYHQIAPAIALDSSDNVHVAWAGYGWGTNIGNQNIQYRKRTTSWQAQEGVTDTANGQEKPAIAIDSSDNVHVVWNGLGWGTNTTQHNIQYRKRTTSWQAQEGVTDVANLQYNASLALDSSDNVHVVWYGYGWGTNTTKYNLQYRQRTTSWQAQEGVTDLANDQKNPCIALDSSNNVHVVWEGQGWGTYASANVIYRERTSSWQTAEEVGDINKYQRVPTLALDSSDNVHVVWHEGQEGIPGCDSIQYRKRTTSWQAQEGLTDASDYNEYPVIIWAKHPTVNGLKPNIPSAGYAFVWTYTSYPEGVSDTKYYCSSDLSWPSAAAAAPPVQIKGGTIIKGGVTIK